MKLTVKQIGAIKATDKLIKLSDGKRLYLEVPPEGSKRWRFRYFFKKNGNKKKENMISLGVYPETSLSLARQRSRTANDLLDKGIDPSTCLDLVLGKVETPAISEESLETFEHYARELISKKNWQESHAKRQEQRLENNIFPFFRDKDIGDITAEELRMVLKHVEDRGALETQLRIKVICAEVFDYARKKRKDLGNPAKELTGELPKPIKKHYPTITHPDSVGKLLIDIDSYKNRGTIEVCSALKIAPYVLLRPGNICGGEWKEINFETAEWHIPAEKMKMKKPHIVPLSSQAIEILKFIRQFTSGGRFIFPGRGGDVKTISTDSLRIAIQRMGYQVGTFTTHGFRHMGTTLLNELDYRREWIEMQLAHVESNSVVKVYNHAQYMSGRRRMMQEWSDYLDGLKDAAQQKQ